MKVFLSQDFPVDNKNHVLKSLNKMSDSNLSSCFPDYSNTLGHTGIFLEIKLSGKKIKIGEGRTSIDCGVQLLTKR